MLAMAEEPLVVVGLLSGGKDSCYNLCHCAKLGHNVVALATLAPPQGKDELDSYMYQTVGHDAVHLIAEAMQLPLYRTTITGQANNQSSSYGPRLASTSSQTLDAADETEDLYTLLRMVKEAQPEVNAVSVGAILSNYQRVRVEHVALRLDIQLLPLSFLWQRNQAELLDEMCHAGIDSVLIKVAGAGLEEIDLGKNLATMRPKLHKLHALYGAHICGEGGEYETLTLDCPIFKKRIVLDRTTTVVHSDSSFASVFYLRIDEAHLEEKDGHATTLEDVAVPALLDELGQATLAACREAGSHAPLSPDHLSLSPAPGPLSPYRANQSPSVSRRGHWYAMGNITGAASASLEIEFRSAFDALMTCLSEELLSPAHLTHLNIHLSSQAHFSALNAVYRSYFAADPPSRACVAVKLDHSPCRLIIDAVAFDDGVQYGGTGSPLSAPRPRRVLHVQGRSYWAAANIGPYSQAVTAAGRISIAGQIGLLPTTLQLAMPVPVQTALALQHARRVFKATLEGRAEKQRGWVEGCICWLDDAQWLTVAASAWQAQAGEDGWEAEWLGAGQSIGDVPITFVVLPASALPRSAAVEWQLFAHDGRAVSADTGDDDDDDDGEGEAPTPAVVRDDNDDLGSLSAPWTALVSRRGASSLGIAHLRARQGRTAVPAPSGGLSAQLSSALQVKLLYTEQAPIEQLHDILAALPAAATAVPVPGCYDEHLHPCEATLIWQSV